MDKYIQIIVLNIVNITIFLIMYYLNSASNKGIHFGVRIPGKYENEPELRVLDKKYKKLILIIMILATIILNSNLLIPIKLSDNILAAIIVVFVFVIILLYEIPFIIFYKKAKKLKQEKGWNVKSNNVVIVDTTLRKPKRNEKIKIIPTKYFIALLVIPITMFILTLISYKALPEIVVVPMSSYGEFNKTTSKGIMTLYQLPIIQVFLGLLFIWINKTIVTSRVDLNSGSLELAVERKKKFRRVGSIFMLITSIEVMAISSVTQLSILYGFKIGEIAYTLLGAILITMIIFTIYSIKIGQGGRNISKGNEEDELYKDDDSKWILGSFYYNKNDPAMMIEKRVGIGWTINFGNTKSVILSVILLVIIICFTVLGIVIG